MIPSADGHRHLKASGCGARWRRLRQTPRLEDVIPYLLARLAARAASARSIAATAAEDPISRNAYALEL